MMSFNIMNHNMMGPWIEFGGWMFLGMVAFWIIVGLVLYLVIRSFYRPRSRYGRALAIARERYARGEITIKEYDEIRKNLS